MSVAVAELDLGDEGHVLGRLVALQRASYAVEAQLIGAAELPPMRETPAQLRACGETFLGAHLEGALVGAGPSSAPTGPSTSTGSSSIRARSAAGSPPRCSTRSRLARAARALASSGPAPTTCPPARSTSDAGSRSRGAHRARRRALGAHGPRGRGAANFAAVAVTATPGRRSPACARSPSRRRSPRARPGRSRCSRSPASCWRRCRCSPSTPTYDPWAWIIWGREVMHLDLVTTDGPSWKPLPILFTAPFSLAGDGPAPDLWLFVARAGGLLAVAMAFRLAARLAGPVGGGDRGRRARAGRRVRAQLRARQLRGPARRLLPAGARAPPRRAPARAFGLGLGAGLLRPEAWPMSGLYGLWLVAASGAGGRLVASSAARAVTLVVWFVPEYLGSGSLLRAAERAQQPNPDSRRFRRLAVPRGVPALGVDPVGPGLRRRGDRRRAGRVAAAGAPAGVVATLAALSTALMVAVALMTEGGFAGNLRYVALPAAMVCILAGAGWVGLYRLARRRSPAAARRVAVVALAPRRRSSSWTRPVRQADGPARVGGRPLRGQLQAMIAKAGGGGR